MPEAIARVRKAIVFALTLVLSVATYIQLPPKYAPYGVFVVVIAGQILHYLVPNAPAK